MHDPTLAMVAVLRGALVLVARAVGVVRSSLKLGPPVGLVRPWREMRGRRAVLMDFNGPKAGNQITPLHLAGLLSALAEAVDLLRVRHGRAPSPCWCRRQRDVAKGHSTACRRISAAIRAIGVLP